MLFAASDYMPRIRVHVSTLTRICFARVLGSCLLRSVRGVMYRGVLVTCVFLDLRSLIRVRFLLQMSAFVFLSDLEIGCPDSAVVVRLVRGWGFRREDRIMRVDMVLVDSKVTPFGSLTLLVTYFFSCDTRVDENGPFVHRATECAPKWTRRASARSCRR